MADYNPIAGVETDPEAPPTTTLFKRLEENPRAIAEGADGAPPVLHKALGEDLEAGSFLAWEASQGGAQDLITSHQVGTIRVQFNQRWTGNSQSFAIARIRVNGSIQGTWNTASNSSVARTIDIAITRGDKVSIETGTGPNPGTGPSIVSQIRILTNGQLIMPLGYADGVFTLP